MGAIGIRLEVREQATGRVLEIIQKYDDPSVFRTRRAVFEALDTALLASNVVVLSRVLETSND